MVSEVTVKGGRGLCLTTTHTPVIRLATVVCTSHDETLQLSQCGGDFHLVWVAVVQDGVTEHVANLLVVVRCQLLVHALAKVGSGKGGLQGVAGCMCVRRGVELVRVRAHLGV